MRNILCLFSWVGLTLGNIAWTYYFDKDLLDCMEVCYYQLIAVITIMIVLSTNDDKKI